MSAKVAGWWGGGAAKAVGGGGGGDGNYSDTVEGTVEDDAD